MLAALLAGAANAAEVGRLETMRLEVKDSGAKPDKPDKLGKPDKPDKPDKPGKPDKPPECDDYIVVQSHLGDAVGIIILEGVAAVLSSPFTIPRAAMSDHGWKAGLFTRYPYSDGSGYLRVPDRMDNHAPAGGYRKVAYSAALAYAKDDAVETFRADFQLRTAARAEFRLTYTSLVEDIGGAVDTVALGDATVLVRFAQHERGQMRFGIGYVSMLDDGEDGAIFVYEGDFFPSEPIIVSAGVDVGSLGDAFYSRWHLSVGVARRNVEFSLGYSSLRVGSVELRGPTVGSRVWF